MGANKEQQQVIDSTADRILCLAAAGSGKTTTMLGRISKLVDDGIAPSSILALTFTNAAAAEMKSRYEAAHPGVETPEFRTFHSFCYSILCKDMFIRGSLRYDSVPAIASEEQIKDLEARAKAQCKITVSNDKLKTRTGLTKKEQFQVDLYDKAVDRLMRSENIITFDLLNSEVARIFAEDYESTRPYKNKYKYIFVDEFQDTDKFQIMFLNSFPNTHFCFVGDCLQNLYSFRGTSNEYIKALSNAEGWEKIRLFTNYRSTNQICEYTNRFSEKYADPSYRIEMKGVRDGDMVHVKLVSGPSKYDAIDTHDVDDVLKEMSGLEGTSAILCRTNKEVNAITEYLARTGVPYIAGKATKLKALLDCAISDTYMQGYLASYLTSSKYGEYIRLSAQASSPDLSWFLSRYGNVPQIREDIKVINALKEISLNSEFTNAKLDAIAAALHVTNLQHTDTEYSGTKLLNYVKEVIDDAKTSGVYVGTIHSVKGLEYDNVFVMNVGSFSFRLNNEDMKNLFYVAVTRAKNHLFVYELFDT